MNESGVIHEAQGDAFCLTSYMSWYALDLFQGPAFVALVTVSSS